MNMEKLTEAPLDRRCRRARRNKPGFGRGAANGALISRIADRAYFVHPKREELFGKKCWQKYHFAAGNGGLRCPLHLLQDHSRSSDRGR